jgi:hypothetical protein
MITPELLDYIKKAQAAGADRDSIERMLIANDWDPEDITEAYLELAKPPVPTPAPAPSPEPVPIEEITTTSPAETVAKTYPSPYKLTDPNQSKAQPTSNPKANLATANQAVSTGQQMQSNQTRPVMGIPAEIKASQQLQSTLSPQKKSSGAGKLVKMILFIVLFVVLAFGAFGYAVYRGTLSMPFLESLMSSVGLTVPSAELSNDDLGALVQETLGNYQTAMADTYQIDETVSWDIPMDAPINQILSTDNVEVGLPSGTSSMNLAYSGVVDSVSSQAQLAVQIELNGVIAQGDVYLMGDTIYVRPSLLPGGVWSGVEQYEGQWYQISTDSLQMLATNMLGDPVADQILQPGGILNPMTVGSWQPFWLRDDLTMISLDESASPRQIMLSVQGQATGVPIPMETKLEINDTNQLQAIVATMQQGSVTYAVRRNIDYTDTVGVTISLPDEIVAPVDTQPVEGEETSTTEQITMVRDINGDIKDYLDQGTVVAVTAVLEKFAPIAENYLSIYSGFSGVCVTQQTQRVLGEISLADSSLSPTCTDTKDSYLIVVEMGTDKFVCTDTSQNIGVLEAEPSGESCGLK